MMNVIRTILFCAIALVGIGTCRAGEPAKTWVAGTVVEETEVRRTGLDVWFKQERISDAVFKRMWLKSWKKDCPLNRGDLRYLKMLHRNADGKPQRGEMVVNAAIAGKVLALFRQLYEAGYRIERMVLIDNYNADDKAAMRANNSSAFNFRYMTEPDPPDHKLPRYAFGMQSPARRRHKYGAGQPERQYSRTEPLGRP